MLVFGDGFFYDCDDTVERMGGHGYMIRKKERIGLARVGIATKWKSIWFLRRCSGTLHVTSFSFLSSNLDFPSYHGVFYFIVGEKGFGNPYEKV